MVMPDKIMSTLPASRAGNSSEKDMGTSLSFTPIASEIYLDRSASRPIILPSLVVMLSGGMLPAVPTTNSPL